MYLMVREHRVGEKTTKGTQVLQEDHRWELLDKLQMPLFTANKLDHRRN